MTPLVTDEHFDGWIRDLERRHAYRFEFRELTRSLRALSATYVERRARLARVGALDTAGKRAVFALFYAPLHFLLVAGIVRRLGATEHAVATVLDLGCGTGAAGAAWASSLVPAASVIGVDVHPWALDEAARTYEAFGLRSRLAKARAAEVRLPPSGGGIVAAFVVNELGDAERTRLLTQLLTAAERGGSVLVVEPIARSVTPWWPDWEREFAGCRGRADEWRLPVEPPPLVARLEAAAGLAHDELTARTLWIDGRNQSRAPRKR